MLFASDNWAGAAPEIVEAVAREAGRADRAYGAGAADAAAAARLAELFEHEVEAFFVATGSAANELALASVARISGVVLCHREAHILEDECGGVELQTGGARVAGIDGAFGKLDANLLASSLERFAAGGARSGQPMAVSITQQTECGTAYAPDEIAAIAGIARKHGLPLHMDGARFANAAAQFDASPADLTWRAGVDILCFGGTKNGCMAAEAIVFFDRGLASEAGLIVKRAGHQLSKARFLATQFEAYLADGLWLELAHRANGMAERLRTGLKGAARAREAWPTRGNEVFAVLKAEDAARLRRSGAMFYDWPAPHGSGVESAADEVLIRLVTSWSTEGGEIDLFLAELNG